MIAVARLRSGGYLAALLPVGPRVLFTPFRAGTAHVVQFGPIRIANRFLQPEPNLDHHRHASRRNDAAAKQPGRSENRNDGAAHHTCLVFLGCLLSRPVQWPRPHQRSSRSRRCSFAHRDAASLVHVVCLPTGMCRMHITLTRSSLVSSWPMDVSARNAWPRMAHVAGSANSSGTCSTCTALSRLHSRRSGVRVSEQTRTRAVSMFEAPECLRGIARRDLERNLLPHNVSLPSLQRHCA